MKIGASIAENVTAMLRRAPSLTFSYVRQEMDRYGKRFRKTVIRERMSGAPGIKAPFLSKGGHVYAKTKGQSLSSLETTVRIDRILKVHEEGATIRAAGNGWLYIRTNKKRGGFGAYVNKATIVARVKQVTIPARLGFRSTWRRDVPQARQRIRDAMSRALRVASERNVKTIINIGQG